MLTLVGIVWFLFQHCPARELASARIVKARIEQTYLGQICKHVRGDFIYLLKTTKSEHMVCSPFFPHQDLTSFPNPL
jgi:hypothetical protein